MIEYSREKAHASFDTIRGALLRARAPMYDEHALIPVVLVSGELPMIRTSWRLERQTYGHRRKPCDVSGVLQP